VSSWIILSQDLLILQTIPLGVSCADSSHVVHKPSLVQRIDALYELGMRSASCRK
jgi:hypothetical protein